MAGSTPWNPNPGPPGDLPEQQDNRQGDRFTVKVAESILVDGVEAIPSGSIVEGRVFRVKMAGRVKGRAEMNLSYDRAFCKIQSRA